MEFIQIESGLAPVFGPFLFFSALGYFRRDDVDRMLWSLPRSRMFPNFLVWTDTAKRIRWRRTSGASGLELTWNTVAVQDGESRVARVGRCRGT